MKLDQFLKWLGLVETGGQAKHLVVSGQVCVNGLIETRRGRKLVEGDRIALAKKDFLKILPLINRRTKISIN